MDMWVIDPPGRSNNALYGKTDRFLCILSSFSVDFCRFSHGFSISKPYPKWGRSLAWVRLDDSSTVPNVTAKKAWANVSYLNQS